jgi:type I restriction enzyme S subunit
MKLFPDHWKTDSVSALCTDVVDCVNKTAPTVDGPTDYKMIRTTNVKAGRINLDDCRYVDEATFVKWTRRIQPKRNDIVLTREAPLGEVGLLRSDEPVFLGQRTMLYRANPKKLDQRFLYYSMLGPFVQGQIRSQGSGATVEHLRVPDAESFLVANPPVDEQRRIAALLSAYDDLITNNQRRIALLESMTEEIYREWFVRMRFPCHPTTERIRGLPTGWELKQLSEVARINANSVRRGAEPECIAYLDISAVGTHTSSEPTELPFKDAPGRARRLAVDGDMIWSSVRPGNKTYCLMLDPPENLVVSTGFAVITPKPGTPFTYLSKAVTTQEFTDQMVNVAKGSAYPATAFDDFEKAQIVWPTTQLLAKFHNCTEPMLRQVTKLRRQNVQLAKQRDALLPRLISGKLRVDALEIQFPPSMQQPSEETAQHAAAFS